MYPYWKCALSALLICCSLSAGGKILLPEPPAGAAAPVASCFIENRGQVRDQYGRHRDDIGFKLEAGGLYVFVGNNGQLHYQFNKQSATSAPVLTGTKRKPAASFSTYRMDVRLLGANQHPQVEVNGKQAGYSRYYTQADLAGIVVDGYERILYKEVYPGIDWEIYVKEQKLKYNFIVHEQGNVADIRLKFDGANRMHLDHEGGLIVYTPEGSIREDKPYCYERSSNKEITSGFDLRGDTLLFRTAPHTGVLVIDPEVSWSTYYGGSGMEEVNDLKTDEQGNVFITGTTQSITDIATTGGFQHVLSGGYDAFVAGFNNAGQIKWATYFGDAGNDYAFSLALDVSGNVLVTGATTSIKNISTAGAHQEQYGGDDTHGIGDAFLVKFNKSGLRLWGTYLGGSEGDCGNTVITDADEHIYIGGYTMSSNDIATAGSHKPGLPALPTGPPPSDAFIGRFNPAGQLLWSTYYGGAGNDQIADMRMTSAGTIIVVGETSSLDLSTPNVWQPAYGGGASDLFITRFNTSGSPDWCTYFGGVEYEHATSMTIDKDDNIYVAGSVYGDDQIVTPNACQTMFGGGGADGFLSKFDSRGLLDWSTYIGGSGFDQVNGMATDSFQNVVVAGLTGSQGSILQAPGSGKHIFEAPVAGNQPEGFFAKYNAAGQRLWGSYYSGVGKSVGCWGNGNIYCSGYTTATGLATAGAYQPYNNGGGDVFLSLIKEDTTVFIRQPFIDTQFCAGAVFRIPYEVSSRFEPGNTFTVLLSDSSGHFSNASVIGTLRSADPGSILCSLPVNAAGNGYRLRIAASHPVDTSADNHFNIHIAPGNLVSPVVTLSAVPTVPVPGQLTEFTARVTNGGTAATGWQWLKNGAPIPGATTNPYAAVVSAGDLIAVIAYCQLPCASADSAVSNSITTSIKGVGNITGLSLYPNPNNGSFVLESRLPAKDLHLQITNVIGQPVFEQQLTNPGTPWKHTVQTSGLVPGVYFLNVYTKEERVTSLRFIVQQ